MNFHRCGASVVRAADGVDAAPIVDVVDGVDAAAVVGAAPGVDVDDGVNVMAAAMFSPRVHQPEC